MVKALVRTTFAVVALALACGLQAADKKDAKLSGGDRSFVDKAMKDGNTEVELGKLVQSKAQGEAAKKFAQRMVDDHTKAGEELKGIIGKVGYTPEKAGPDQKMIKALSGKSAARFDHEYAEMMVKDHEKAVKLFKKQSEKGDNADLKQFAAKTLPTLEEHLKMAKELKEQTKGKKK